MCEDCDNFEQLCTRINQIYIDLKSGVPKIRAMYNLDDIMKELNRLAGFRD